MVNVSLFLLVAFSFFFTNVESKKDYSEYKIVEAIPKDEKAVLFLRHLEINENTEQMDFLNKPLGVGKSVNIKVHRTSVGGLTRRFSRHGVEVKVTVHNVQRLVDREENYHSAGLAKNSESSFNLTTYNSFDNIIKFLRDTCENSLEDVVCEMVHVGKTYEGRDLMAIKINMKEDDFISLSDDDDDDEEGKAANKKPIFYVEAGIHAREWIAPAATVHFVNQIFTDAKLRRTILSRYELYVIPSANPDGYTYSRTHERFWRKTRSLNANSSCVGTDPNRNFDALWSGPGSSPNPCSNVYQGTKAFSEVETRSMADLMLSFKGRMQIYVAVHSYSQMWLVPYAYTKARPTNFNKMFKAAKETADVQSATSGYKYTYGQTARILYLCAGGSDDWALDSGKAEYSYTVELPDTGVHGFDLPSSQISRVGKGLTKAFEQLVKSVQKYSPK